MAHRPLRSIIFCMTLVLMAGVPRYAVAQDATPDLDPGMFSPTVTNPFFPLASVSDKVFEGDTTDPETGETVHERVEERVLPDTATVAGIDVTVVEVYEYADGEVTEHTLDYYAQHEDGTVYYLGEDVDNYEDGVVVDHDGAWRAGEGENQPGVFMPAVPEVGASFAQERAPGTAEDSSTIIAVDQAVTVQAGAFAGCIRTEDVNPLDDTTEYKDYCPGVGVVREESDEGALGLITFSGGISATPVAATHER